MKFTTKQFEYPSHREIPAGEDASGLDTYTADVCECGGYVRTSGGRYFADCPKCGAHWERHHDGSIGSHDDVPWIHLWGGQ